MRWYIEQFHREVKQLTGIERCQCRREQIQRNHIVCALLVWTRLKQKAHNLGQTVYQLKQGLLKSYLITELRSPTIFIFKISENESDETGVEKFRENPYWQYFCGLEYFVHEIPCHPTTWVKGRKRLGIEPVIGRLKEDNKLCRNHLLGKMGDYINGLLSV